MKSLVNSHKLWEKFELFSYILIKFAENIVKIKILLDAKESYLLPGRRDGAAPRSAILVCWHRSDQIQLQNIFSKLSLCGNFFLLLKLISMGLEKGKHKCWLYVYIHQMFELPDKLQCSLVQATTYTGYGVNKQTLILGTGGGWRYNICSKVLSFCYYNIVEVLIIWYRRHFP